MEQLQEQENPSFAAINQIICSDLWDGESLVCHCELDAWLKATLELGQNRFVNMAHLWPESYYPVAIVQSIDLSRVFGLMQHHADVGVNWIAESRTTSVGDVIVTCDEGRFSSYCCTSSGWQLFDIRLAGH